MLFKINFNYFQQIKLLVKSKFSPQIASIKKFWYTESGEWHWLKEKPMPIASLNRSIWRISVPSFSFHFMLGLSSVIATLGLLADSVAVIIGAMIIAPLMGPILGIAYSATVGNRRLLRRSMLTLSTGIILTIITAWLTTLIVGLRTVSPEILSRTNPTLLDLSIALAAGSAGAFANSRRRIADALPGVAIAVALVPPLSVVGIGLAFAQKTLSLGAFLLFVTNLVGIIFSGSLVFLFQSYGNLKRAKKGLFFSIFVLSILGLPLSFSLRELLVKESVRSKVSQLVRNQTLTFANSDINSLQVESFSNRINIQMQIAADEDSITQNQIELVRDFLAQELQKPVELKVVIVPVNILQAPVQ
ncbi:hypothetical protein Sta7437_0265 [Stanieria cyanosphaera PCC 7437]|uniref:TIGR00341 family protein n=1 Tax=Stanieria cyanosphaera (strain ATCC 29371 / PCC 7437) TaxID=111780 RepID=K9XPA8_STAC7|nr:TIGR00341 family protein [Stanieria cyanosphaera]AFZ33881.1 hypothetical protein Sta7437_0265 [Stanieria cyanosphaera PCC 7437]